jgi:ribonucleotide reductase beta subunit family protein with ferritin-like domain
MSELYKIKQIAENEKLLTTFPILLDDVSGKIYDFDEAVDEFEEELLRKNINKYSLYPITYDDVYTMYKKARASYWQPEEISFMQDDWSQLNPDEQHFIKYVLAFFAASDGIVNENIDINFSQEIEIPEVRAFYAFQEAMEAVHSETYSILLDTYIKNPAEKLKLQSSIQTIKSIKSKADWALSYMNPNKSFATRLFAFACVEGIYFSGSFCAIYWLKSKRGTNLLPALTFSNELISRDEGLHTSFALLLYSKMKRKLTESEIYEIITSAVANEKMFILECLPCRLIGMNSDMMSDYIEFVADDLLLRAGYNAYYKKECPFDFMENLSLETKSNFFEKKVSEYAKASVMNKEELMSFDEDF